MFSFFALQQFAKLLENVMPKMNEKRSRSPPPSNLKEYSPWLFHFQSSYYTHTLEIPGKSKHLFTLRTYSKVISLGAALSCCHMHQMRMHFYWLANNPMWTFLVSNGGSGGWTGTPLPPPLCLKRKYQRAKAFVYYGAFPGVLQTSILQTRHFKLYEKRKIWVGRGELRKDFSVFTDGI